MLSLTCARRLARSAGLLGFVFVVAGVSHQAAAQPDAVPVGRGPLPASQVPDSLRPWIPWVLYDSDDYGCTWVGDERECAWPGHLDLALRKGGGTFRYQVYADRPTLAKLPGDETRFPQNVRVDGVATPVRSLPADSRPAVFLNAGSHRIEGTFRWNSLPELLAVPKLAARVTLSIENQPVVRVRRNDEGAVWLEGTEHATDEEGRLELEVFRRIDDGVPLKVITQLDIRASGPAREVNFGRVILPGTTPTALESELAVRMSPAGDLVAQVHAGTYSIRVIALTGSSPKRLSMSLAAHRSGSNSSGSTSSGSASGADDDSAANAQTDEEIWPSEEIWAWAADEKLRQVELAGAPTIDPARTNLPANWRSFPAYVLKPERGLELTTTRSGEPQPPPNDLSLRRELWLDLDGSGYTVRDHFTGTMNQRHRLDLTAGELGHVVVDGRDQLITEPKDRDGKDHAGVELRSSDVRLRAEWRRSGSVRALPAVGWSEDVQSLSTSVHLPPGWSLLAAPGADEATGTWIDQWNLWGIFFVLILALAASKLWGVQWGLVALVGLALCYHEPGAPRFSWITMTGLAALLAVLPVGLLRNATRFLYWFTAIVLLLLAVPFAAGQLKVALYPHLAPEPDALDSIGGLTLAAREAPTEAEAFDEEAPGAPAPEGASAPEPDIEGDDAVEEEPEALEAAPAQSIAPARPKRKREAKSGGYGMRNQGAGLLGSLGQRGEMARKEWADPNEVVQTGPGVPDWSWRAWSLSWTGPVTKDHQLRLMLISPLGNRFLALLRVMFLGALLFVFLRRAPSGPATRKAVAAALLALLMSAPNSGLAQDTPSDERLEELKTRLTKAPDCLPNCVLASSMRIDIKAGGATVDATVHASAQAAYRIPGPLQNWVPDVTTLNGKPTTAMALRDEGFLFLRLPAGTHQVRFEGVIPRRDVLTLAFGEPPRALSVSAPGWETEGLRSDGRVSQSIQFRREITTATEQAARRRALLPWLLVHRRLEVGVRWTLHSTVERITPPGSPVVARIPLLAGERVTDPNVSVQPKGVVVSLGRDDQSISWTSVLKPRAKLSLTAAKNVRRSERWTLACGPIWRCEASGIAPVHHHQHGNWEPEFSPWPGETIELQFNKPEAAPGQSTTIDRATLTVTPGVRMLRAKLDATIRTTQGNAQTFTLPPKAKILALSVDGQTRAVQQEGQKVRVTLHPGSQEIRMRWQQPSGLRAWFVTPKVHLGGDAVNVRVKIEVPKQRWLLWADGPAWGVAILFWPYLLLVIALALVLGRTVRAPLRSWEWMLLGLGLTQVPAPAALVVVGWFVAMDRRRRNPDLSPGWFDLRQLALGGFTLITLGCLYAAVHTGLLVQPDMQVVSPEGTDRVLSWYTDRTSGGIPRPRLLSLPIAAWRMGMLLWALWLAWRLIHWLRWGWSCIGEGGLWKRLAKTRPLPPGGAPAVGPSVGDDDDDSPTRVEKKRPSERPPKPGPKPPSEASPDPAPASRADADVPMNPFDRTSRPPDPAPKAAPKATETDQPQTEGAPTIRTGIPITRPPASPEAKKDGSDEDNKDGQSEDGERKDEKEDGDSD